ncbi:uncharacterized protein LOC110106096 [Dendrobium catenatum]|uniref:S-adenosyl-L-methionine-dependent methyltransferase n=2 Tax=Dendrobium TaxID=37818 RepID=A0A2I0WF40_9ASPA|nr:uncharacterized protein LOC110106096 [Dendrobium catenatum]PKU74267.1 hypothetical protein MA16_Dca003470 [Dendrobium catenatum]
MKDSSRSSPPPALPFFPPLRRYLPSATVILLLFSLGYIAGLLSSPSSTSSVNPQLQSHIRDSNCSLSPPHDLFRFHTDCAKPIPHDRVLPTLLNRLFNNTSPYSDFPSPETANLLLPPAAHPRGWGSTKPVFSDLISTIRPLTIIELGTFLGASALHMASLTRNLSLPNSLILCLDDFRGWPAFRSRFGRHVPIPHHADSLLLHQFMLGVSAAGETHRILPVPFSTSSGLAALCEWGIYGDLIEVDAGHDFHSAWSDINMAYAVLRPGGVLFGHDYYTAADDHGVRRAVTLFSKAKGLKVRPHGEHWVLSPKPVDSVPV